MLLSLMNRIDALHRLFKKQVEHHKACKPISRYQNNPHPGGNMKILGGILTFVIFVFFPNGPGLYRSPDGPFTQTIPSSPTPSIPLTAAPPSKPFETPTPAPLLPTEVMISGIRGYKQSMPLSCESRSAVDWAAYFGTPINEKAFFDGIPASDNPEEGFVGSVYGSWGQIPPRSYGVHAIPIAQRLREYGLNAKAVRDMTLKELKAEVASGQPVIVWVIGHVGLGTPTEYTAGDGEKVTVAKFEHTVIVIGYTEHKVTFLDGAKIYSRYKKEFQKSWNVLDNQAVIWID